MTYIVNESCIKCKLMDCVEVCPVDCFYEGENMLVIHPDECIDCGVCEPECPVEAIKPDTEAGAEKWLTLNSRLNQSLLRERRKLPFAWRRLDHLGERFSKLGPPPDRGRGATAPRFVCQPPGPSFMM